jgi:glutamate-1-semialdehyde 2,1-aminomutase
MTLVKEAESAIVSEYEASFPLSRALYARAKKVFPGGVTHESRFLLPFPVYVKEARRGRKWTVEGKELVDLWMGHGALLLGHGRPEVLEAIHRQIDKGTHPGACHELEIEWAEIVRELIPSAEWVRFTSSGTEACIMALRLARAATGKSKIIKFLGHFHGWNDHTEHAVLPPFDEPMSPGILQGIAETVICLPANNLKLVEEAIDRDGDVAAVILEPTGGGFGCVPTLPEFVRGLREVTRKRGVVFIMDEVITGFRVAPGGLQQVLGIRPDITMLAKILAGGLPGGAVAGKQELFAPLTPGKGGRKGKMHHPGTYNANPVSAAAGIAALKIVRTGEPNRIANERADTLRAELNAILRRRGIPGVCYGQHSDININLYPDVADRGEDIAAIAQFAPEKLRQGAPSPIPDQFRLAMLVNGVDMTKLRGMTGSAHDPEDIDQIASAFDAALTLLCEDGHIH